MKKAIVGFVVFLLFIGGVSTLFSRIESAPSVKNKDVEKLLREIHDEVV